MIFSNRIPRRILSIVLIFALCFSIAGCKIIDFDIEDSIKPPEYNDMAIKGSWKIEGFVSTLPEAKVGESDTDNRNKYLDKWAIFDDEVAAVASETYVNPQYKIIRTSADSLMQNKYRIDGSKLGLGKQDVSMVNVYADNQVFYEVIITDSKKAYIYIDNGFLLLSKISENVDIALKDKSLKNAGSNVGSGQYEEDPLLRSGLLLGIRTADNTYRTIWIYSKNREINAVNDAKQLLVPRAKGFWRVGTIIENNIYAIYAEPFREESNTNKGIVEILNGNFLRINSDTKIQFIGNDYIGTESNGEFKVYPVDTLKNGEPVSLSQISGQITGNAIEKAAADYASSLKGEAPQKIISKTDETNFTLIRRNGHWIMRGRLNYKQPYQKKFQDFDLKLMVPTELICYDEMNIPWNYIKKKIPWTSDAFMSPNRDIVVLADKSSLSIYTLRNRTEIDRQLLKLQLSKGETIVMAEWSIGRFADLWDNFVNKMGKMNY